MKFLVDVSLLVARLDAGHERHADARSWMDGKSLAVCPLTELGAVRVLCATTKAAHDDARASLRSWLESANPEFVPCDARALDGHVAPGASQTTDYYFGNLAEAHGLKWATLDGRSKHPAAELV